MVDGGLIEKGTGPMHNHAEAQVVIALTDGVEVVYHKRMQSVSPLTHHLIPAYEPHYVRLADGARAYTLHLNGDTK
jgi:hypothetical protein